MPIDPQCIIQIHNLNSSQKCVYRGSILGRVPAFSVRYPSELY